MTPHLTKNTLRTALISRRKALDPAFITAQGDALLKQVRTVTAFADADTVAAYVSMGTEIPTFPVLEWLLGEGKRVLVPRLGTGREIGWSFLTSIADLAPQGPHRPDEPRDAETLGIDAIGEATAILAPALFVDVAGYRLGRGAGWYDRTLAFRSPESLLAAVVYPWEVSAASAATGSASAVAGIASAAGSAATSGESAEYTGLLERNDHDVPVDTVITPEGVRGLPLASL